MAKSDLKCEIGLELVVDLIGLGLDLLHRLLHLLPRLHVRPVAIRLRPNVLPQPPEQKKGLPKAISLTEDLTLLL